MSRLFGLNRALWTMLGLALAGTAATLLAPDEAATSQGSDVAEAGAGKHEASGKDAAHGVEPKAAGGEKAASEKPAAEKPAGESKAEAKAPARDAASGSCLVDERSVEDLQKRRKELDARADALAARESDLKSRERAIEEELQKLQAARDELNKSRASVKKENEEKVSKLVETVEGMSPKSAAQLLASIDEDLAVATMSRMSTAKLSKVMNIMEQERSTRLSEALAGVARAPRKPVPASLDRAAATESLKKGGEKPNGNELNPGLQPAVASAGAAGAERQPAGKREASPDSGREGEQRR